jgi:hypothetical protein
MIRSSCIRIGNYSAVLTIALAVAVSSAGGAFASDQPTGLDPASIARPSIYSRFVQEHLEHYAIRPTMPPYFRQALPAALSISFLEVSVDTAAGRFRQSSPTVSRLASGRHLVHWVDQKNGTNQIVGRVLDASLTPLASDFFLYTDDVERNVSDLTAGDDGRIVNLIWRNGELGNIGMALLDSQSTVLNSHVVNDGPPTLFVASPNATRLYPRSIMTAWEEFRGGWRIMGQPFDSTGVRMGGNVNLDGGVDSILRLSPALAADTAGGYLVAWSEGSASRCDLYVRLFDASHVAKGPAFALTAPVGTESYMLPAVAYMDSTDEFWVVYVRTDSPADSTALLATRLTTSGVVTDSARSLRAGPYPWEPTAAVSNNQVEVYSGRFDNQGEIRALSLDAAGTITDSSAVISTAVVRERGAVSSNSGSDTLAVVWQDRQGGEYDIHVLQRENSNSIAADTKVNVEGPGGQQFGADITRRSGGGVHAVFTDAQLDDGDI